MSALQDRNSLAVALDREADPAIPADFLALAAGCALEPAAGLRAKGTVQLAGGSPDPEALRQYLGTLMPARVPGDWRGQEDWVRVAERVGLALKGASEGLFELPAGVAEELLAAQVEASLVAGEEVRWMCPLVAEASNEDPWPTVWPWRHIRSLKEQGLLSAVDEEVLRAWCENRLHRDDHLELQHAVRQEGPWREAYVALIQHLAGRASVPRYRPEWSVRLGATDLEERSWGQVVLRLPLPHLGPGAQQVATLRSEGVSWRRLGPSGEEGEVTPYGATEHRWTSEVLGEVVTQLAERELAPLEHARDASDTAAKIGDGENHPRAKALCVAVAEALESGEFRERLARAAQLFASGEAEEADESSWAAAGLKTRVGLELAADRLREPELDRQLARTDEALHPYEDALLLLSPEEYADLTESCDVDEQAWWGVQKRHEARAPIAAISAALDQVRAFEAGHQQGKVVSIFDARARRNKTTARRIQPILREPELRAAASSPRAPGEMDLLVKLLPPAEGTRVIRVRVTHDPDHAGFADQRWFAPVAFRAIEAAYDVASRLTRAEVAPYPLEEHRITVVANEEIEIDGESLGGAFLLAFASLWLDRAVPENLFTTIGVSSRGLAPVMYVFDKALAVMASSADLTLATHADNADEAREAGCSVVACGAAEDLLRHAGLESIAELNAPHDPGDRIPRLNRLRELSNAVQTQDTGDFAGWGDPWTTLARRIATIADSLADYDDAQQTVARARSWAALAYVHAGRIDAANAVLPKGNLGQRGRVVRDLARLTKAIDNREDGGALRKALSDQLEGLDTELVGFVLGTQGRSLLHEGRVHDALPLLQRGVEHHAGSPTLEHEVGRSRVHLATALRVDGQLEDALRQLEAAEDELDRFTRPHSREYYQSCLMYLRYERARVLVELGEFEAALESAWPALNRAQWLGNYPQLGILRVMAWAFRALHRPADSQDCIARMDSLPTHGHPALEAIKAEARALPSQAAEIY